MLLDIKPHSKPRMTRADKWKKRKCVQDYWAFKDKIQSAISERELDPTKYGSLKMKFYVPMPKSWSRKKKLENFGQPHRSRPDIDNYVKGLLDALYKEDSTIHRIFAEKIWWDSPSITIQFVV